MALFATTMPTICTSLPLFMNHVASCLGQPVSHAGWAVCHVSKLLPHIPRCQEVFVGFSPGRRHDSMHQGVYHPLFLRGDDTQFTSTRHLNHFRTSSTCLSIPLYILNPLPKSIKSVQNLLFKGDSEDLQAYSLVLWKFGPLQKIGSRQQGCKGS